MGRASGSRAQAVLLRAIHALEGAKMKISVSVYKRFQTKYIPVTESGCWLWTASLRHGTGYGQMHYLRKFKPEFAHRISWILHRGPIPTGMLVLHQCDVRCCVNPDHLYIGTPQQNVDDMIRRGRPACVIEAQKTHCKRGHLLAGDNLYKTIGRRCCRACRKFHSDRTRKSIT